MALDTEAVFSRIDDTGTILGEFRDQSFVLAPIPEPGTWTVGIGLFVGAIWKALLRAR